MTLKDEIQTLIPAEFAALCADLEASVTLPTGPVVGIVIPTYPPPGAQVGVRSHAPTHVAYLEHGAITTTRYPFPITYEGVQYAPLAQADDLGMDTVWSIPCVQLLVFYDTTATVNGQPIRLRVEAQAGGAARVTSGNDLATVPLPSHRGFLPQGTHLNLGDPVATTGGQTFQVVQPIQRGPLGDSVGLSWGGGGTTVY